MKFGKDGEYYFLEIENKGELEKLKEDILRKAKEKQKRRLT
jgi:hypothetical protein